MNRTHFERQMARMGIAFGEEVSAPRMLVYWDRVSGHSDETFTDAVNRIIDTERRFPNVATIHGHCDRAAEEAARQQRESVETTPRLRRGERLPDCATCLDSGWIRVESPALNRPSMLTKCPDCDGQVRGRDPLSAAREHDASAYMLDRDHARYPAEARANAETLHGAASEVAHALRMSRPGESRPQRHDVEGAACRWTPPMPAHHDMQGVKS